MRAPPSGVSGQTRATFSLWQPRISG
jgi:hypothetical protein